MKTIIHLANVMHDCDYWQTGRTVEKMGLAGLSLKQTQRRVLEGEGPKPGDAVPHAGEEKSHESLFARR
ncbi:MAG TPA: hypothetical protein VKU00_06865 [Chthonomonadaceae bacterium]|nr:hypothetical protein [Chthonomonadaceae bacterium]